jgi:hypothetical protein
VGWSPPRVAADKYDLISRAYDEVNELDKHQDKKAERAIQALAFLTLSAATIFGASLYEYVQLKLNLEWLQGAYILFVAFAMLLILGSGAVLWGIMPRFNIPSSWGTIAATAGSPPKSLFFAVKIAETRREDWVAYWRDTPDAAVLLTAVNQLAFETHLISEKVLIKVSWTRLGFRLYLASLVPLIAMLILIVGAVWN